MTQSCQDKKVYIPGAISGAFFSWWGITFIGALLGGLTAENVFDPPTIRLPLPSVLSYLVLGSLPLVAGQFIYLWWVVRKVGALNAIQNRVWLWLPSSIFVVVVLGLPFFDAFAYREVWDKSKWLAVAFNPLTGLLIQGFAMCGILRAMWVYAFVWAFVTIVGAFVILLFLYFFSVSSFGWADDVWPSPITQWVVIGTVFGFWQALVFSLFCLPGAFRN